MSLIYQTFIRTRQWNEKMHLFLNICLLVELGIMKDRAHLNEHMSLLIMWIVLTEPRG